MIDVPLTVAAPAMARSVVSAVARGWGLDDLVADAQLVVSELVGNAYQHAPGTQSVELELARRADGLRISLVDGSAVKPLIRELQHDRPGGWGLRIVDALASDWGSEEHEGAKRVWVNLDRRSREGPPQK